VTTLLPGTYLHRRRCHTAPGAARSTCSAWREAIQTNTISLPRLPVVGPPKRPKEAAISNFHSPSTTLCQLHDIHAIAGVNRKLGVLVNWGRAVETSWNYVYYDGRRQRPSRLFLCGKSYQTVQELVPVLLNLLRASSTTVNSFSVTTTESSSRSVESRDRYGRSVPLTTVSTGCPPTAV
jgi:hypothetical protein